MPSPLSPRSTRSIARGLALVTCSLFGCSDEDTCEADKSKVESCNRVYKVDICASDEGRCSVHCAARLSCSEFDELDQGRAPTWLSRCFAKCQEKLTCDGGKEVPANWQCDGAEDCVDGKDEKGCRYFECKDGQLVREDASCDQYSDCQDGSDEADCAGFCRYEDGVEVCQ